MFFVTAELLDCLCHESSLLCGLCSLFQGMSYFGGRKLRTCKLDLFRHSSWSFVANSSCLLGCDVCFWLEWGFSSFSVWTEECCLAAGCIMRSSNWTKYISEFGELWYVRLFPLHSLAHVSYSFSLFSFPLPPLLLPPFIAMISQCSGQCSLWNGPLYSPS